VWSHTRIASSTSNSIQIGTSKRIWLIDSTPSARPCRTLLHAPAAKKLANAATPNGVKNAVQTKITTTPYKCLKIRNKNVMLLPIKQASIKCATCTTMANLRIYLRSSSPSMCKWLNPRYANTCPTSVICTKTSRTRTCSIRSRLFITVRTLIATITIRIWTHRRKVLVMWHWGAEVVPQRSICTINRSLSKVGAMLRMRSGSFSQTKRTQSATARTC